MITLNGNRINLELSIQEALELQSKLANAIASAIRQREGLAAGVASFSKGMPIVDTNQTTGTPGVFTISVDATLNF